MPSCNIYHLTWVSLTLGVGISVIQVYAPISNTEEAEVEQFYEDLQDLLELTPPKRFLLQGNGMQK